MTAADIAARFAEARFAPAPVGHDPAHGSAGLDGGRSAAAPTRIGGGAAHGPLGADGSRSPAATASNAAGLRQAAVLVPIVLHPAPTVLLTVRAANLSAHAGQVAFPGGRIEPGETPEAAAIREAAEEVGLDPRVPEVLGRLPGLVTGTGYFVTPVVALLRPPVTLTPDAAEVAAVFELALDVVLDPGAPVRRSAEFQGRMREFWVWPHAEHCIWGATGSVLVSLAAVLRDGVRPAMAGDWVDECTPMDVRASLAGVERDVHRQNHAPRHGGATQ